MVTIVLFDDLERRYEFRDHIEWPVVFVLLERLVVPGQTYHQLSVWSKKHVGLGFLSLRDRCNGSVV